MFATIRNYGSFDFSSLSADSMAVIIWGICAGIIVGILCSVIHKHFTHAFIKALVKSGCVNEETARTLDELHVGGKWYLQSMLDAPHKAMRRYVVCANEEDAAVKKKNSEGITIISARKARFYLPEENRIKAQTRFSEVRKPIFSVLIPSVLIVLASIFTLYAAPELIQMLNNFLSTL